MSKAMLIMDMPKKCHECPFAYITLSERECLVKDMDINVDVKNEKPTWCPLKEVPQKENGTFVTNAEEMGYVRGYNACVDDILKGVE